MKKPRTKNRIRLNMLAASILLASVSYAVGIAAVITKPFWREEDDVMDTVAFLAALTAIIFFGIWITRRQFDQERKLKSFNRMYARAKRKKESR